jgi:hypothetical protein
VVCLERKWQADRRLGGQAHLCGRRLGLSRRP